MGRSCVYVVINYTDLTENLYNCIQCNRLPCYIISLSPLNYGISFICQSFALAFFCCFCCALLNVLSCCLDDQTHCTWRLLYLIPVFLDFTCISPALIYQPISHFSGCVKHSKGLSLKCTYHQI